LTSNQKVLIHNTYQKSNRQTLFLFSEKQNNLQKNNTSKISQRSEVSPDTGVPERTPAAVWILGWSRSLCQYFRFEPEPESTIKVCAGVNQKI